MLRLHVSEFVEEKHDMLFNIFLIISTKFQQNILSLTFLFSNITEKLVVIFMKIKKLQQLN
jgi:hypothetical protein